ncbi:AAA family ATPase [Streptomyces sp. NPDC002215]|uniref:AAA family ATPase n=1 Tax=Streptomyces sp. NPDC002215 TaxID=3154412 RepID=UPI0033305F68
MTGNATNVTCAAREPLLAAAERHNMLPIAVLVATPVSVCIERQGPRPANRTVPQDTVIKQGKGMADSYRRLKSEGFPEIVFSDSLRRLSDAEDAAERGELAGAVARPTGEEW